jgi:hypothetical protein
MNLDGAVIDSSVIGGTTAAAGSFTTLSASTSITGTLATAAQPNITSVGTLTGFTSTGIDDNATSTAITIDSSENVGIGLTNQANKLQVDGDICIGKATTSADLKSTLKMRGANGSNQLQVFDLVNDGENGRVDFKYNRAGGAAQTIMSFGATVGNVGIGTSSPSHKLDVLGDSGVVARINGPAAYNAESGLAFSEGRAKISGFLNGSGAIPGTSLRFYTMPDNGSVTEAMRVDSSGNVGIGTSSPSTALHIYNTGARPVTIGNASATWSLGTSSTNFAIRENSSSSDYVTINSLGQVGIGTSSPDVYGVHASQSSNSVYYKAVSGTVASIYGSASALGTALVGTTSNHSVSFYSNNSERMRIDSSGNVGIGTTSVSSPSGAAGPVLQMKGSNPELAFYDNNGGDNQASIYYLNNLMVWHSPTYGGSVLRLATSNGNLQVIGALSKGSGSFKIDHPLESKKDTHELVHSFIEGPQADLIYRGKIDLVDGSATVNIDTVAGMTEGTFVALNREVQCFTSNESDWDAVKGSVSGNILTIECQNTSSTATVSWLVIGERQDQHMYDTDWTDDNGKVIVEPLKGE